MASSPFLSTVVLLLLLAIRATAATAASPTASPGCQDRCGGVEIPYPFGIGAGCFRKGFEIGCRSSNNGSGVPVPVLATTSPSIRVLSLSVAPRPEARVLLPVAWQCFNSTGDRNGSYLGDVNFNQEGVYRISDTQNELYVLGCNTLVYTKGVRRGGGRFEYAYYTGCVAVTNDSRDPRDGACTGLGCCHVDIPPGLTDTTMSMKADNGDWSHANQEFCPCDYAFIVEKGSYTFRASDLTTTMPLNKTMPLVLDWAIRNNGSTSSSCGVQAENRPDGEYACLSGHSECINSTNGPGYVCSCIKGFEGNPYVVDRCININECTRPEEFPCHGECKDTEGSYDCKCRPGYESDGDPKEKPCNPKLSHSAKIYIGICLGTFFLIAILLVTWLMFKQKELKARKKELVAAMEKKNGGEILKNVETLKIFLKEELDKITNNYSDHLGHGGFGNVYKGTLPNNTEVAVKASIKVTEDTLNEFVKEVEIQSRMMHKNILRLLGCCLKVDIPLLVYEYAAKGTLQDILHGKESDQQREMLPLNSRLDIAIGSAQGLAYMHSYTENGIQHADVQPSNILLDGGLVPKISDFGLSKMFNAGQLYTKNVVGCLAYMDPEAIVKKRLTQKSDVYSFGIVLLELICRKPVQYGENCLIDDFKRVYARDKSGRAMFDNDIAREEDIHILDQIGILALKCIKENFQERPAMVNVASELVLLKASWEEKQKRFSRC